MAAVAALSACASGPPGPPPGAGGQPAQQPSAPASAPEAAPGPGAVDPFGAVELALLVPSTAENENAARLADALVKAARMAEEELGPDAPPLVVYDTGGVPEVAAETARRAVAEGADLILGPLFSVNAEAVAPVAGAAGLKVLAFSNSTAVAGGPVYLLGSTPEVEVRRVLGHAAAQGLADVAVFYPETDYGLAALRGAEAAAAASGARIAARVPYERSFVGIEQGSARLAEAVTGSGASALLLPAGGDELKAVGSFVAFREIGLEGRRLLGTQKWKARATFEERALRGGWFAAPDPVREQGFAQRYADRYGQQPPPLAFLGYDAVRIAGKLLFEARAQRLPDAFAARDLMRPTGFEGATGPIRFTPDQVAERGMAILEVGQGRFEVVAPAPLAFAAGS